MSDVVERLRATHIAQTMFGGVVAGAFHIKPVNPDGPEAADEIERLRELLGEAREVLAMAAEVPLADPLILTELVRLCDRVGYGNVMVSVSAIWRVKLGEFAGGEFSCAPCRGSAQATLARIDAALKGNQ